MQVEFNRRALWGLAAFLALPVVAADHPIVRVGVVGGAAVIAVILDLLTWRGVSGLDRHLRR